MPEGNILCLRAAPNTIKNFDRAKSVTAIYYLEKR